jgi:hypothetical protein
MICPRSINSLGIPHTPHAKNWPIYGVCHQDSRNFSLFSLFFFLFSLFSFLKRKEKKKKRKEKKRKSDASRRISDYEWERAREINRSRKLAVL